MPATQPWNTQRLEEALVALEGYRIPRERICIKENEAEVGRGGYGVVRLALLKEEGEQGCDRIVAVKQLRPNGNEDERTIIAVRLARELRLWSTLSHQHVLTLIGFCFNADLDEAWLVSPYEAHGNIIEYLTLTQPDSTERLSLAKDTADGLAYLHGRSPSVIHGDLKGSNVLVNRDRRAILCDFGLSKALSDVPSGLTTTRTVKGTLRYLSPEVLNDEKLSVLSDMWAWGCLAFEILTSLLPYYQVKTENALLLRIASGTKPASLEEHPIPLLVREIVHDCWHFEPHKRPRIHSARKALMFCLPRFDGLDEALDELILSEMSEEMSTDDPTFTETIPDTPENESSYPFATSATPETSAEIDIELVPLRSSVPSRAVRLRPILRKESISGESSDTESILSVISNDGTASANQVSTPTPESPPDFDLPVRRPLVGVYEWLAVEAALLESDDEEQGEEEVNGARPEREEVRVRRHRPGVTFDLSDDDDFATSGDDAIIPSTHFQSSSGTSFLPQSPQIQIPVRSHYPRVSSPPPKPFALSTDSDADSSRPGSPSQSLSPLTSSPISSVPPTRFSPPPQRPPPLPEVAAPIPLTKLSDDLVAQVKDHCRAAAGSVDWQELGPAREHLRAALAILEGTTAEDRHDVVTTS